MILELIPIGILQGLILSFVALGVMIPLRFVNFPDLTAEGSFPLGGAVCAALLLAGVPFYLATIIAVIATGCIGIMTAMIHLRFQVNTLLAGIIVATMVYSINLRLLGQPNVALFDSAGFFQLLGENSFIRMTGLFGVILVVSIPFRLFLRTEKGLCFRAAALNPLFAKKQSISIDHYTVLGLFIGNALCGLAGAFMVQLQGYTDISMGVGIVIHALAALMIGESLIGTKTLNRQIAAPILGALVYQQIQGLALALGLAPSDLKLLTGIMVLTVIALRGKKI